MPRMGKRSGAVAAIRIRMAFAIVQTGSLSSGQTGRIGYPSSSGQLLTLHDENREHWRAKFTFPSSHTACTLDMQSAISLFALSKYARTFYTYIFP
jgi:hypothetical protein